MGRSSEDDLGATPYDFGGPWQPSEHELARRAARKKRNKKNALIASISSVLVLGTLAIVIVTSPGWKSLSETFFAWAYGVEVLPKIILGFGTNVLLTAIAGTSVAILGLTIALVLALEAVNTAVESVVDLVSPGYHPLAKVASNSVRIVRRVASLLAWMKAAWESLPTCKRLALPSRVTSSTVATSFSHR